MARPEKVAAVDRVRDDLSAATATLFTEYRGLSVADMAELRRQLREAGARYLVVKNTLARIAAREAGFDGLDEVLTGPTAIAFTGDDPVSPAKALRRFGRDHPELVVKGAIIEGRVVDADTAGRLADLETREELLARFAGLLNGALANFASLLQAPLSHAARLLAAFEQEGGAAPEAEPAAAEEPETPTVAEQAEAADVTADAEAAAAAGGTEVAAQATTETQPTDDESEGGVATEAAPEATQPPQDVPADEAEEPAPGTGPTDATTTGTEPVDETE